jgi:hypothetical protein
MMSDDQVGQLLVPDMPRDTIIEIAGRGTFYNHGAVYAKPAPGVDKPYDEMTADELKDVLRKQGKKVSGDKAALRARVDEPISVDNDADDTNDTPAPDVVKEAIDAALEAADLPPIDAETNESATTVDAENEGDAP